MVCNCLSCCGEIQAACEVIACVCELTRAVIRHGRAGKISII
uniref:Uncharacterized protein n=1 Tax=Salmonella sp. 40 TaxID=1179813 RepID=I3W3Q2_9ENTR|nr:hypothetical protein [Salmonella sp. 40]